MARFWSSETGLRFLSVLERWIWAEEGMMTVVLFVDIGEREGGLNGIGVWLSRNRW